VWSEVFIARIGKMIRQFKNSHSSHIFDVRFDVGRIVRCDFITCIFVLRLVPSNRLALDSTSHDQKIVILDFTKGINTSLFV
jgi:F-box and WD-40 domain protein 1/11